jgi:hypothetical protein
MTLKGAKKAAQTRKRRQTAKKAATTRKRRAAAKKAAETRKRRAAAAKAAVTRKRNAAGKQVAATKQPSRGSGREPITAGAASGRETVLKVGAEGGSLSILRMRVDDGPWRFVVYRDESTLAGLLNEDDRQGLTLTDESGSVESLAEALRLMDRYPWHMLVPLALREEYESSVMAAVLHRGGTEHAARWKRELARRRNRDV